MYRIHIRSSVHVSLTSNIIIQIVSSVLTSSTVASSFQDHSSATTPPWTACFFYLLSLELVYLYTLGVSLISLSSAPTLLPRDSCLDALLVLE